MLCWFAPLLHRRGKKRLTSSQGSNRAKSRLRPGWNGHHRRRDRWRVPSSRKQDMDYQCPCRVSSLQSAWFASLAFCLPRHSNVFIIWARCKWDGKVRGFILEKACQRFRFPNVTVVPEWRGLTITIARACKDSPRQRSATSSRCARPRPGPSSWTTSKLRTMP